jgi:hypothetical protein
MSFLNKNAQKILQLQNDQFIIDIIFELPLHLSRLICNEWIDVYDICNIDKSYCNKSKRQKIIELFNNLLIFGLNESFTFVNENVWISLNDRKLNTSLYIKWLIKNNIQVQYFDDKYFDIIDYSNLNVHEIYKVLCKLNRLSLLNSEDINSSNNNLFQLLQNNQFNDLRILDLNCSIYYLTAIIDNNLNIQELIFDNNKNIDDDYIMFIIENCEHLKILSLQNCDQLSDLCFTKLTKQNKNLIKLNIDYFYKLTDLSLNMISIFF